MTDIPEEKGNPRALLKEIMAEMPDAGFEEIFAELKERVERSPLDYRTPLWEYWFEHEIDSVRAEIKKEKSPGARPAPGPSAAPGRKAEGAAGGRETGK